MSNRHYITWDEFHRDTTELAKSLEKKNLFGLIAVTRGGLVPAAILAHCLDIRLIETASVAGCDDTTEKQGSMKLIKSVDSNGEGMAIIDDLADSGATMKHLAISMPKATRVAVYTKPQAEAFLHNFARKFETGVWVVFPWEKDEFHLP